MPKIFAYIPLIYNRIGISPGYLPNEQCTNIEYATALLYFVVSKLAKSGNGRKNDVFPYMQPTYNSAATGVFGTQNCCEE